jgi:hypothetical protein
MRLTAISHSRHNGGVKFKRLYGSSTLTTFLVFDDAKPTRTLYVEAAGKTPGERKTLALETARPYFEGTSAWPEPHSEFRAVKARPVVAI